MNFIYNGPRAFFLVCLNIKKKVWRSLHILMIISKHFSFVRKKIKHIFNSFLLNLGLCLCVEGISIWVQMPAEVTRCSFPGAEVVNDCETPEVNARNLTGGALQEENMLLITESPFHLTINIFVIWSCEFNISKLLQKNPVNDVA